MTVAADPDVFPFGTVLYIEDVGVRIVQDKGAGIQGKHLDIAVSGSHEDALSWQGIWNGTGSGSSRRQRSDVGQVPNARRQEK